MNITPHPWPDAQSAHDNRQPIQFRAISAPDHMAWLDYEDSQEPPTFSSKVLMWRAKPAVLHPVFEHIIGEFNSVFGGVA